MDTSERHEALWQAVPSGREPSDFALRCDFLLEHVDAGDRVLDVGCAEGRFASELARAGAQVVGVDVAEEPLRRARERDARLELRRVAACGAWDLDDGAFDVVWAGEVIEHVADPAQWLSELRRVLRSGGTLLLSTPHHSRVRMLRLALSRGAFAAHFDPLSDHLRFYDHATLSRLVEEFGFERVAVRRAVGPPWSRRLLLLSATRSRF